MLTGNIYLDTRPIDSEDAAVLCELVAEVLRAAHPGVTLEVIPVDEPTSCAWSQKKDDRDCSDTIAAVERALPGAVLRVAAAQIAALAGEAARR